MCIVAGRPRKRDYGRPEPASIQVHEHTSLRHVQESAWVCMSLHECWWVCIEASMGECMGLCVSVTCANAWVR